MEQTISILWELVGSAGALLTMFGFVPQITKIYGTKSSDDISLPMLLQFSIGVFLWMLYGIHLENIILIVSNLVSLLTLFIPIGLYFRYRSRGQVNILAKK
jgi:MtN3 and saliva related transmembrane protein